MDDRRIVRIFYVGSFSHVSYDSRTQLVSK